MKILEVNNPNSKKLFHKAGKIAYEHDESFIAPLEKDVEFVFNETQNPAFENGKAIRWVLVDSQNNPLGRIAAFVKGDTVSSHGYKVGGCGFFECINDTKVSEKLFNTASEWLQNKGMQAMDGPINFGERDKFWGLLVEGFTPPTYMENYNPPYYKELFQDYGFVEYFEQHTYEIGRNSGNWERLAKLAEMIGRKRNYQYKHLNLSKIDSFADDFIEIYNAAWSRFQNFQPLKKKDLLELFKQMKPILIEELIIFIYIDHKPAGLFVILPDVNQLFKYTKGRWNLISKLKFLWHRQFSKINRLKGLIFGVHPSFQNMGIDALLVHHFLAELKGFPQFDYAELSWIGGFNPKMQAFMANINAKVAKKHITYRKSFDPEIKIERFRIEDK